MQEADLIEKLVLIAALAVAAQWLAWRVKAPGIVFLAAAGLIAGPGLGLVSPEQDFGALMQPMISLAVAIILFEGGLHLRISDLREVGPGVWRLVFIGAPLSWAGAALAGVYIMDLSWPTALLFGGILVVTGPTVIMPLLRQARLHHEPAALLKWEGIVNDPVGAMLAVIVFEIATLAAVGAPGLLGEGVIGDGRLGEEGLAVREVLLTLGAVAGSAALGYLMGRGISKAIHLGLTPEFIKGPLVLAAALVAFLLANLVQKEAGLVAVTVLGVTLANTGLAEIDQVRRLKEYVTVLLVSGLFVVLSATLDPAALLALGWPAAGFLAVLMFVVRPVSVFVATIGAGLSWRVRLLVAWVAPRGIVAVAVSGLFGGLMVQAGYEDAEALTPLAFAVVFATVIAHGFTLRPLAQRLGLASGPEHGVLIVGAGPWSSALGATLAKAGAPVLVADHNPYRLRAARRTGGVTVYAGEILSELAGERVDLGAYQHVLALSDDDAYNALVCSQFGPELGARNTVQLASHRTADGEGLRPAARGRVLMGDGWDSDALSARLRAGWRLALLDPGERVGLSETAEAEGDEAPVVVAKVSSSGAVAFALADTPLKFSEKDRAIMFMKKEALEQAA